MWYGTCSGALCWAGEAACVVCCEWQLLVMVLRSDVCTQVVCALESVQIAGVSVIPFWLPAWQISQTLVLWHLLPKKTTFSSPFDIVQLFRLQQRPILSRSDPRCWLQPGTHLLGWGQLKRELSDNAGPY